MKLETPQPSDFDPYYRWLGIPKRLRPPNHYQLLGISPKEGDHEIIEAAVERQTNLVKTQRDAEHDAIATRILYEIQEAGLVVLDSNRRQEYDASLAQSKGAPTQRLVAEPLPPYVPAKSVGEQNEIVRSYLGIVSILLAAFIIMAVVSFMLPWRRVVFGIPDEKTPVEAKDGVEAGQQVVRQAIRAQRPVARKGEGPKVAQQVPPALRAAQIKDRNVEQPASPAKKELAPPGPVVQAHAVLKLGGSLTVSLAGEERTISPGNELPTDAFDVIGVSLRGRHEISDDNLGNLSQFSELRSLNLMETGVTNEGLSHIEQLMKLEILNVAATSISDDGLSHLAGLQRLQELYFGGCPIQGEGLVHLKSLSQLRILGLIDTQMTDAGLAHLQDIESLTELRLRGAHITDAGVKYLVKMPQLQKLNLANTKISNTAMKRLRQALPGCEMTAPGGQHIEKGLSVIGKWQHSSSGSEGWETTFLPNGHIGTPDAAATWTLKGRTLTLRWPQSNAPNGVWVDRCVVSPDGKSYAGKNQKGAAIRGTRLD